MSGIVQKIDWDSVRRVLVIRLRSIGDTVLATPSLAALRRFLPRAEIHVLLEDWVAPLLNGSDEVDRVVVTGRDFRSRIGTAAEIRRGGYDVVINLHGGTTSAFLTRASGAAHRIGFSNYRYSFLYNHTLDSATAFWKKERTHSAEQQLALLGFAGVPVDDRPASRLPVSDESVRTLAAKLGISLSETGAYEKEGRRIALIHPAAATKTKQWPTANFARVCDHLFGKGLHPVAVAAGSEIPVLEKLSGEAEVPVTAAAGLSLPEITALASVSAVFVGNDSGIAHMAAAVGTPSVVIFGSSNRDHWGPWTAGPSRIVFNEFDCQPCPGFECAAFGRPRCILEVGVSRVISAVDELLCL